MTQISKQLPLPSARLVHYNAGHNFEGWYDRSHVSDGEYQENQSPIGPRPVTQVQQIGQNQIQDLPTLLERSLASQDLPVLSSERPL